MGGPATPATARQRSTPTGTPAPAGYEDASLTPAAARFDPALGEFVLDVADLSGAPDPHADALGFARSAFAHIAAAAGWDPALAATVAGTPPPVH